MATVRMILNSKDKPSEAQLEALRKAKEKPIIFDDDSPEMTPEMLKKFQRVYPKEKQSVI